MEQKSILEETTTENFDKLALTWDNEPRRIERAQAVAREIINTIPNLSEMSGFEYGCGTGLLSFNLQPYLKYITLGDNSDGMLMVLKEKIQNANIENMTPLNVDLTKDKMPNIKSDLAYTLMTMHHIENIDDVIKAFYTILNPGGYLFIADLEEEDGSYHEKEFVWHNGFNRKELSRIIKSNGFKIISDKICYEIIKKYNIDQERKYPVFIMIAQKE